MRYRHPLTLLFIILFSSNHLWAERTTGGMGGAGTPVENSIFSKFYHENTQAGMSCSAPTYIYPMHIQSGIVTDLGVFCISKQKENPEGIEVAFQIAVKKNEGDKFTIMTEKKKVAEVKGCSRGRSSACGELECKQFEAGGFGMIVASGSCIEGGASGHDYISPLLPSPDYSLHTIFGGALRKRTQKGRSQQFIILEN